MKTLAPFLLTLLTLFFLSPAALSVSIMTSNDLPAFTDATGYLFHVSTIAKLDGTTEITLHKIPPSPPR